MPTSTSTAQAARSAWESRDERKTRIERVADAIRTQLEVEGIDADRLFNALRFALIPGNIQHRIDEEPTPADIGYAVMRLAQHANPDPTMTTTAALDIYGSKEAHIVTVGKVVAASFQNPQTAAMFAEQIRAKLPAERHAQVGITTVPAVAYFLPAPAIT